MAEIKFSKLKLKVDKSVKTDKIKAADGMEYDLEVKQYIPIQDKILIVSTAVENSIVKGIVRKDMLEANLALALIYNATNLKFTDKMLEKSLDLYDILVSNGVVEQVEDLLSPTDKEELVDYIQDYSTQMQSALVSSVSGYSAQEKAIRDMVQQIMGDQIAKEFGINEADVEPSE